MSKAKHRAQMASREAYCIERGIHTPPMCVVTLQDLAAAINEASVALQHQYRAAGEVARTLAGLRKVEP